MENYDLIVIGGGPGGYLAAERAAAAGKRTLLFEKRALGGVCLNEGCIPSKSLLQSAKTYDHAIHSALYGVSCESVKLDQNAVIDRKNKVVKTLVSGIRGKMKAHGVTVVTEEATITGKSLPPAPRRLYRLFPVCGNILEALSLPTGKCWICGNCPNAWR